VQILDQILSVSPWSTPAITYCTGSPHHCVVATTFEYLLIRFLQQLSNYLIARSFERPRPKRHGNFQGNIA
jgi:hypothetical protein